MMRTFERRSPLSWITLGIMIVALCALAFLQYQWIGQITQAEQDRLRARLKESVTQFRNSLYRDLSRTLAPYQIPTLAPGQHVDRVVLERAGEWPNLSGSEMVRDILLVTYDVRGDWQAHEFQPLPGRLTQVSWPAALTGLPQKLSDFADHLHAATPREWHRRPWVADDRGAVLFRPLISAPADDQDEDLSGHELLGYLVVELNQDFLRKDYFPDLVRHSFGPSANRDYHLTIGAGGNNVLYETPPDASGPQSASPDLKVDLFRFEDPQSRPRGPLIGPVRADSSWVLSARHHAGSLESAAGMLRRRNLAVSTGVFALLLSSLGFLLLSARRARQLAQLQVDFVAGISHELRTPVASVCMVAENMVEGMVDSPEQSRRYGALLKQQGRRLTTMVEQTLLFAAFEKQGPRYDLRAISPAEIVAQALSEERPLIDAASLTVEQDLPSDLPHVMGDPAALKQCTGNLLSNAVKYASQGGWIGLRADAVNGEVRITVADRGPGIDAADRAQLFEPFYRGTAAREAQVYGSGLGLSLVKRMIEAMGGEVTVESEPGKGSAFTLHLKTAANHE